MTDHTTHIEVIWGNRLLDEGFTSIPNLLIRNYRRLNISHGEWGFICTLLTYKHDARDPYPSQETLAQHLDVSVRQIKKWVESLVSKQLLLVGQRRNAKSKVYGSAVYNFKLLIEASLNLLENDSCNENEIHWQVDYKQPSVSKVHSDPRELKVHSDTTPEVHTELAPQVHPKKIIKKTTRNTINKTNKETVALQNELENILGQSIKTIEHVLSDWIYDYGIERMINTAKFIANDKSKWINIIGTFRTALLENWELNNVKRVDNRTRDSRYDEFYKLFPDITQ